MQNSTESLEMKEPAVKPSLKQKNTMVSIKQGTPSGGKLEGKETFKGKKAVSMGIQKKFTKLLNDD